MPPLRRSPRIMELNKNKEANVTANQITASRPMIREANLRRTPPHLLNQERRRQINIGGSSSMSHQLDCSSINPTQTSYQVQNSFGLSSTSSGNFSFPHGNHGEYTGVVPRDGRNIAYLYVPLFSPSTSNNSIHSSSLINEGAPMIHNISPGHLMRPLVGENNPSGSNPRAAFYQLNHQLPSCYPGVPLPRTSQNNVDFFGHQQHAQYQIQCNQPARPLPSYPSSQITTTNTSNAGSSHLQSILGKRPAESESFFHLNGGGDMATVVRGPQCNQLPASNAQWPLPTYQSSQISTTNTSNAGTSQLQSILGKQAAESESFFHLDGGDDMATVARGPQCSLDTDNLLSLYQSVGTPEFLATSERVLASGRSLYEPTHAAASVAAPAHFPMMSSNAVPAIARMWTRETMTQKTLGLDGQGSSKSTMQRRP